MLAVLGLLVLAVAGGLWWFASQRLADATVMLGTKVMTVGDLATRARDVDGFRRTVALKGSLTSEEPLTAELSGERCAQVLTRVSRRYEETFERMERGRTVREHRTGTELLSELRRVAPAALDDGTGSLPLDLEGATVELRKVVDRFEPDGADEDVLRRLVRNLTAPAR